MPLPITGVVAALITPVTADGRADLDQFDRLIDFIMDRKIDGLCIGGGTSEYPHFSLAERKQLITRAGERLGSSDHLVSAVGASSFAQTKQLADHAASTGSTALLVPPPHFYPCEQQDLAVFYREVARMSDLPCLIYNLPAFTQPLEQETVASLLTDVPNIEGIKDSSGTLDHLGALQRLRGEEGYDFNLLCGSDEIFLPALEAGWDGSISGLASCCPELLTTIYGRYRAGDIEEARHAHRLLHEFAERVLTLPFPWGIRVAAEVRGIENGPLPLPLSSERKTQIINLRDWFEDWFSQHLDRLSTD